MQGVLLWLSEERHRSTSLSIQLVEGLSWFAVVLGSTVGAQPVMRVQQDRMLRTSIVDSPQSSATC